LNPNIPALATRMVNALGFAMQTRFDEENKTGVLSVDTYSAWWNGGMRSTPFFHNTIGVLTEVAHPSPYPATYTVSEAQREITGWYPNPYTGGRWRFADTVAYMNTGSRSLLTWAVQNAQSLQLNRWRMAHESVIKGNSVAPYAFVVPMGEGQRDPHTAALMLERLRLSGIEITFAEKPVTLDGKTYPKGTAVIVASQANRPHLLDMLTAQKHPTRRNGPDGPPIPPYDIAGWTLPLQMGVNVVPVNTPVINALVDLSAPAKTEIQAPAVESAFVVQSGGYLLSPVGNRSFLLVNRLLKAGIKVQRTRWADKYGDKRPPEGSFLIRADYADAAKTVVQFAQEARVPLVPVTAEDLKHVDRYHNVIAPVRVGVYAPYGGTMPGGWAEYVLDSFEFPCTSVTNEVLRGGKLTEHYNTLILTTYPNVADRRIGQAARSDGQVERGNRLGSGFLGGQAPRELPKEAAQGLGGIGSKGEENLREFVEGGGTLIAYPGAAQKVIELFHLPIRDVTKGTKFYSPGSIFRAQVNPSHESSYGLPGEIAVFFDKGMVFDSTLSFGTAQDGRALALYPEANPLLSGWIVEDQVIRGKAAAAQFKMGAGHVLVFGFEPTFRGQPHQAYPLLFNALFQTPPPYPPDYLPGTAPTGFGTAP
jgi:hypothetical protein